MSDPQKLLPIPDRIYVERDETTNVINAYSCKGMGEEFVRASVATPPEDNTLREALEAASHALRSYQYGNASTELAKAIADKCDAALSRATKGGEDDEG